MKAAWVFSGQGAQKTGMGKDLFESSPAAAEIFREANRILNWDLMEVCFNGPDEKLTESKCCQPAIFTVSMAALAAFREKFPHRNLDGGGGEVSLQRPDMTRAESDTCCRDSQIRDPKPALEG